MPKKTNDLSPEEYRRKWGVPDWRDKQAYPDDLPDELWRWEFLRRRGDYRRDWEREHAKTAGWYKRHSFKEWMQGNLDAPNGPIEPGNFECNPSRPEFVVWMKHSVRKYRMPQLINPSFARPEGPYALFSGVGLIEGTGAMWLPPGSLVLELDPMSSLEEHVRILKIGLKHFQRALGRANLKPHKKEWCDYLRVLDAKGIEATNREIWEVISGGYANNPYARGRDLVRSAIKTQNELTQSTK